MGRPQGGASRRSGGRSRRRRRRPSRSSTRQADARADLAARSRRLLREEGARRRSASSRCSPAAKSPEDYWDAAPREIAPDRSTGQRRALADWITDVDHGAGAAAGPRDRQSGLAAPLRGRPGAHASATSASAASGRRTRSCWSGSPHEFVAGGWRLKPLHRLILTSAAYMQDTTLRRGPRGEGPRQPPAVAAPAAAAGGRGPARRRAVGERHAEPASRSARRSSRPSRPRRCSPATRRTRIPKDARDTRSDPPAERLHVPQAGRPAPADAGVRRPGRGRELRPPQRHHRRAAGAGAAQRPVPPRPRRRLRAAAAGRGRRDDPTAGSTRGFELALSRPPSDAERAASVRVPRHAAPAPVGARQGSGARRASAAGPRPISPRCSSA